MTGGGGGGGGKTSKNYCPGWEKTFPWLEYRDDKMYCGDCLAAVAKGYGTSSRNKFAREGNTNFYK